MRVNFFYTAIFFNGGSRGQVRAGRSARRESGRPDELADGFAAFGRVRNRQVSFRPGSPVLGNVRIELRPQKTAAWLRAFPWSRKVGI